MRCPDLGLDIVQLGSDAVILLLQVLHRWLRQLLAIILGMVKDKREIKAAAEVKDVVSFCLCLSVVVKLELVLLL